MDKTNFIYFQTRQRRIKTNHKIEIASNTINKVKETQLLEFLVDENVLWNIYQSFKISSGLYVLRTMSKFYSVEKLEMIYFARKHSHNHIIWYCFIWSNKW